MSRMRDNRVPGSRGELEKGPATAADHRGPRKTEAPEPGVAYSWTSALPDQSPSVGINPRR